MSLFIRDNAIVLWQQVLSDAVKECGVALDKELETYLVSLLMRYTDKPEITSQIYATKFLEALKQHEQLRNYSLQQVGDQCLLYAGLFPEASKRRLVKIDYFIDLGRSAYTAITGTTRVLYATLADEFVQVMDVFQSIRPNSLTPWDAHEQWQRTGSQRALRILKQYEGSIIPLIRRR